jgi:hypothetical protein
MAVEIKSGITDAAARAADEAVRSTVERILRDVGREHETPLTGHIM